MFSTDNNVETIAQLAEQLKRYLTLKGEYYRLDFAEKVVRVVATVVMTFIVLLLSFFILGFLSLTVAFALEPLTGKAGALAIIAAIYLLLFLLCIIFRKQWIEAPLVRFFASLLME
ncbi:MAG: phage holin family protein [Prevotella sp.]|nr:phage holin family protein [Prevotella sp.]